MTVTVYFIYKYFVLIDIARTYELLDSKLINFL